MVFYFCIGMEHISPSAQQYVKQFVTIRWAFEWGMLVFAICVNDDFHQTVLWLQWNICKVASASVTDCLVSFYFLFSLGYVNHWVFCTLCIWRIFLLVWIHGFYEILVFFCWLCWFIPGSLYQWLDFTVCHLCFPKNFYDILMWIHGFYEILLKSPVYPHVNE